MCDRNLKTDPVCRRLVTSAGALKAVWCVFFALRSASDVDLPTVGDYL